MDVDTRVLRYYVAVAEHLSFTRAARELFVSQPSLSRQIQRLESELGAALFVRTGRQVRLTAAGESLLPVARRMLGDWRQAVREVRTSEAARKRLLRVGFVATGAGSLGRRARAVFTARHPEIVVEPKRFDWGGEADALRQGLADVAFVWLPADLSGLHAHVVATEPRWVAMAATHPLAAATAAASATAADADADAVSIMDLRDEPLMWTRKAPREWVDWWAVNPRPDGSAPRWGPENDNVEEMLEHVAAGHGVCLASESMAGYYAHPELTWRRVTDIEPLRVAVAWPEGPANPLVRAFVETVTGLATASPDRPEGAVSHGPAARTGRPGPASSPPSSGPRTTSATTRSGS
ncbi:LysR family transcriptional regulator [Streptomyces sp. URMC 129]|uniref:LysR family transcriptional regulator n=1 Tax=Streptomyces sp. URMC 129 TaxID=3423407 RepID=UPI003F1BB6F3